MTKFTQEKLRELDSYRALEKVTKEVDRITGYDVDTNDIKSLERKARGLKRLEKLDLALARNTFRLELVKAGNDFLPLISRISLLAGFDPELIKRRDDANEANDARLKKVRRFDPYLYNRRMASISIGGESYDDPAHPIADSGNLERILLDIHHSFSSKSPTRIGMVMKAAPQVMFVGSVNSADALPLVEPEIIDGAVKYEIPRELRGVGDIQRVYPSSGKTPSSSDYPLLFTTEKGSKVTAHPSLVDVKAEILEYDNNVGKLAIGERAISSADNDILFSFNPHRHRDRHSGLLPDDEDDVYLGPVSPRRRRL